MMHHHQVFAGPLRVRNIMMAVSGFLRARYGGTLSLLLLHFRLDLDLLMDGVRLRPLLFELSLVPGGRLVGLRPRLRRQKFRVGRRRRRLRRWMQQLSGLRVDRAWIAKEAI